MARILIVEDNPANLKLASFLLKTAGHEVIAASDAASGIAQAENARPDLVLMDIQLPGMDGLEATRRFKSAPRTRDIRIIALTALAMKGDRERILAAGCDGYIAKPFGHKAFITAINHWLHRDEQANDESLIE